MSARKPSCRSRLDCGGQFAGVAVCYKPLTVPSGQALPRDPRGRRDRSARQAIASSRPAWRPGAAHRVARARRSESWSGARHTPAPTNVSSVAVALVRSARSPRSKQSPAWWTVRPLARTSGLADALLLDAGSGSPWVDAGVTASMRAASRRSASTPSNDRTRSVYDAERARLWRDARRRSSTVPRPGFASARVPEPARSS